MDNRPPFESELDTARRHVAEAEERLRRQTEIAAVGKSFTDDRARRLSQELLKTLTETVRVARNHVGLIQARSEPRPRDSLERFWKNVAL
jgi:hypothetical protein